jgi:hypothetical protein
MTAVIERIARPVRRKQKTITIVPDEVEKALQQMIDMVDAGRHTRGAFHHGPFHCALGMIEVVTGEHPY